MEDTPPLQIVGSNGNHLRFTFRRRTNDEAIYEVSLRAGWMTAETKMTTYLYGPPTKFFEEMASSWRGWDGDKTWAEIEGRVSFGATIDRLGHVALKVVLRRDAGLLGNVADVVELEAGGLGQLASEVRRYFDAP